MAIFHFSAKTVSRSEGRSSVAAAAYRSGECLTDERTGEISDYRRKGGVVAGDVVLPDGKTMLRSQLWNAVEAKHKRGDALVAREFELALPHELSDDQRAALVGVYARELADKYGVAVDWNIHSPGGDELNHHAHVMLAACYCAPDGTMGKKAVELDPIHCARAKILNPMEVQRARWQDLCNQALERAGQEARIDHRTLEAQGIERAPGVHLGPAASAIVGRGEVSQIDERAKAQADEFIARVQAQAAIEQAQKQVDQLQAEMALMEREEDDGVRIQALERIGSNVAAASRTSRATDRACSFAVADHASTDQSLGTAGADLSRVVTALRPPDQHMEAARAAWPSTVRAVRASGNDLGNSQKSLGTAGANLGRAVQITGRRQHHRHAGAVAQAVGRSLERLVPALAAIHRQIELHLVELATKAREAQAKKQLEKQIMATQAERDIAAEATRRKAEKPSYRPTTAELKAVDEVLIDQARERLGIPIQPNPAKPVTPSSEAQHHERIATELEAKGAKLRTQVASGEKSDTLLVSAVGYELDAAKVRKIAQEAAQPQTLLTPSPAPEKTLSDRLVASFEAMLDWIKSIGAEQEPVTASSRHDGPVKQLDDLHAVQKTGRRYAVHRLADLDKVPALDDPKMVIRYKDGKGTVEGKLGQVVER